MTQCAPRRRRGAPLRGAVAQNGPVNLRCVVLADDPSLEGAMWAMPSSWPEFMLHDPIGNGYYAALDEFAEYVLVCFDEVGDVVAKAFSVPFHLDGDELPVDGWDGVIRRGLATRLPGGPAANAVSAVEIAVRPDLQGRGLSAQVLAALRDNAARLGYAELVAPVRPNGKADPHQPMTEHAFAVRGDGLPVDPWLRVHVRAGGRIDRCGVTLDGDSRDARGVARLDRPGLRPDRPGEGARRAHARPLRRGERDGCLRRAERLGAAPHRVPERLSRSRRDPACRRGRDVLDLVGAAVGHDHVGTRA